MGEHQYERTRAQEGVWPRPRQNKVAKELAGLATDLPLDARSSVFVRTPLRTLCACRHGTEQSEGICCGHTALAVWVSSAWLALALCAALDFGTRGDMPERVMLLG